MRSWNRAREGASADRREDPRTVWGVRLDRGSGSGDGESNREMGDAEEHADRPVDEGPLDLLFRFGLHRRQQQSPETHRRQQYPSGASSRTPGPTEYASPPYVGEDSSHSRDHALIQVASSPRNRRSARPHPTPTDSTRPIPPTRISRPKLDVVIARPDLSTVYQHTTASAERWHSDWCGAPLCPGSSTKDEAERAARDLGGRVWGEGTGRSCRPDLGYDFMAHASGHEIVEEDMGHRDLEQRRLPHASGSYSVEGKGEGRIYGLRPIKLSYSAEESWTNRGDRREEAGSIGGKDSTSPKRDPITIRGERRARNSYYSEKEGNRQLPRRSRDGAQLKTSGRRRQEYNT